MTPERRKAIDYLLGEADWSHVKDAAVELREEVDRLRDSIAKIHTSLCTLECKARHDCASIKAALADALSE